MKLIDLSNEKGSITGFVTSLDEENFNHYLEEHLELGPIQMFLEYLQKTLGNSNFTLLKNLYVEHQFRGQGVGPELLAEFFNQSSGPVILICDNLESQVEGFNLQNWYMDKYGFKETGFFTLSGPILIRD